MRKTRKVHWAYLETRGPNAVHPACGETARGAQLTHDQAAVTCGRCRRLLGIVEPNTKEGRIAGAVRKAAKAQGVTEWRNDKAIDSLMGRAFVDVEARLAELCTKSRKALADWEQVENSYSDSSARVADNMADILRGFISALGRAD